MIASLCLKRRDLIRLIFRYWIALLTFTASLYLLYTCYQLCESSLREFASISPSETSVVNKRFLKTEADLLKAFTKSNGFLAATRTNQGKISTGSPICLVDPAVSDCVNMGFAAFVLLTLDHIMLCSALGSDRPVVFWRACYSVCSRNPNLNSWNWYFEPVNPGLEKQVGRVLCPLLVEMNYDDLFKSDPDLMPILDNSFKNRSNVDGFENSKIITTRERIRVKKLIQQYVRPNNMIKQELEMFYHRYLSGNTVLGVHVRGTDHWIETSERKLPPLMSWVISAQSILETLPRPRKIFIAGDNDEVINKFVAFFGKETVVFTKAVRAKRYRGPLAPHDFKFEHNPADPYERAVGTQVLLDILLLAKCDHFLHAESSVASLASYFNPHMKSYFMDGNQVKERGKIRKKSAIRDGRKPKQEDTEKPKERETAEDEVDNSIDEMVKCFQRNSMTSPCPNAAKGIFLNLSEAQEFFKPRS